MSGKRLLLDTNAIVALLQGNQYLMDDTRSAEWIGISIISEIEFLCFSRLTDADRQLFAQFVSQVEVIGLASDDERLIRQIVEVRQSSGAKLPDAIIAATALCNQASLVSADRRLTSIANLHVVSFDP